jgi:hypothetical protein
MIKFQRKASAPPEIAVTSFEAGETVAQVSLYPPFADGLDVVVLATPQGAFGVHVTDISESGFTLELPEPQTEAVRVAWQVAVARKPRQPVVDGALPERVKPEKPHPKPGQMLTVSDIQKRMDDVRKNAQSVHSIAGFRGA